MGATSVDPGFEEHRRHLLAIARAKLDPRLHCRLDPSGIVQETLLAAWKARAAVEGADDRAVRAWLKTILAHRISNAVRDARRKKRGGARVFSFTATAGDSSATPAEKIAAPISSPSKSLGREEIAMALEASLAELPGPQRLALVLRFLEGLPIAGIAARLGRSEGAVSMLIHRGLRRLKEVLGPPG